MYIKEIKWNITYVNKAAYPIVEIVFTEKQSIPNIKGTNYQPINMNDANEAIYYMIAVDMGDRVDVKISKTSMIELYPIAIKWNLDIEQILKDNGIELIENAGFAYKDETDYHFKDNKYNKIQDLAIQSLALLSQLDVHYENSYNARYYQIYNSGRDIDDIELRPTKLEKDHRPFDFPDDYWLDNIDIPFNYAFAIYLQKKNSEKPYPLFMDAISDINTAYAYADIIWNDGSVKDEYQKFELIMVKTYEDVDDFVYTEQMVVLKDYLK